MNKKFKPALIYTWENLSNGIVFNFDTQYCLLANSMDSLKVFYENLTPNRLIKYTDIEIQDNYFYNLGIKFKYLYPILAEDIDSMKTWLDEDDFDKAWNKYKKPYKLDSLWDLDNDKMEMDWKQWGDLHNQKVKIVFV